MVTFGGFAHAAAGTCSASRTAIARSRTGRESEVAGSATKEVARCSEPTSLTAGAGPSGSPRTRGTTCATSSTRHGRPAAARPTWPATRASHVSGAVGAVGGAASIVGSAADEGPPAGQPRVRRARGPAFTHPVDLVIAAAAIGAAIGWAAGSAARAAIARMGDDAEAGWVDEIEFVEAAPGAFNTRQLTVPQRRAGLPPSRLRNPALRRIDARPSITRCSGDASPVQTPSVVIRHPRRIPSGSPTLDACAFARSSTTTSSSRPPRPDPAAGHAPPTSSRLGPVTLGDLRFGADVAIGAELIDAYHVNLPIAGAIGSEHRGTRHRVVAAPRRRLPAGRGRAHRLVGRRAAAASASGSTGGGRGRAVRPCWAGRWAGRSGPAPSFDTTRGPGLTWSRMVNLLRSGDRQPAQRAAPAAGRAAAGAGPGRRFAVRGRSPAHRGADRAGAARAAAHGPAGGPGDGGRPGHTRSRRPSSARLAASRRGRCRRASAATSASRRWPTSNRCGSATRATNCAIRRRRDTVAAIAHAWGFGHLGRFAAAYRERIGESPSATLRGS